MKVRSAKNKGKRLQNYTRDIILEIFKDKLERDDVRSTGSGQHGEDIQLSPAARKLIPFSIECKNQENINLYAAIEQNKNNCKDGIIPIVIFKKNRKQPWVCIKIEDLINFLS